MMTAKETLKRSPGVKSVMFATLVVLGIGSRAARADIAYAWGINDAGELGNGTYDPSYPFGSQPSPAPVINLSSGVTAVAAGSETGLAVQSGAVYAWGDRVVTPVAVAGLSSGVTAIAAGDFHSLALQNGGTYAWGDNSYGELGDGTTAQRTTAVPIAGLSSGVTAIAAGRYYSLAIQNGGAYAWGANWHGQLGDGTTSGSSPNPTPVPVTGLSSGVTAIAAGGSGEGSTSNGEPDGTYYSDALAVMNGGVYAWGTNGNGELGNGTTTSSLTPVPVIGLSTGVTAIAAGSDYNLAVRNGNVYAWGFNFYGELGDGTNTTELVPEEIDPVDLANITSVASADFSSYALSADGSLWVWGYDFEGELGLGSAEDGEYLTPQHLLPPSGYVFTSISGQGDGDFALATLAPVPEPTTLSLLAISGLALLGRRRRRR